MNKKEYHENLAKVYIYDPETGEKSGGPLVILTSWVNCHKVGDVVTISSTDGFEQHRDMFMKQIDYDTFIFMKLKTMDRDAITMVIRSIEYTTTDIPGIGSIHHPVILFEIM